VIITISIYVDNGCFVSQCSVVIERETYLIRRAACLRQDLGLGPRPGLGLGEAATVKLRPYVCVGWMGG
jgi:hypothetical protein